MKRILTALSIIILVFSFLAVIDEASHTLMYTLVEKVIGLGGLYAGYHLLLVAKPELQDEE